VNWGSVNATIPKSTPPDSVSLSEALELIAEKQDRPGAPPAKSGKPKSRAAKPTAGASSKGDSRPAKSAPGPAVKPKRKASSR